MRKSGKTRIYERAVRIAGVVVRMRSDYPLDPVPKKHAWVLKGFLVRPPARADIDLVVKCSGAPSWTGKGRRLFFTKNPAPDGVDWSLRSVNGRYVIVEHSYEHSQVAEMNTLFSRGTVYLPGIGSWNEAYVVFHALQIIMLNYLAGKGGIFVHSMAVVGARADAYLFAGSSSAGKSTLAGLFQKEGSMKVIGDDRVIVREINGSYYLFATPWHSSFKKYLDGPLKSGRVKAGFFIKQHHKDRICPVKPQRAFPALWSNLFLSFWNKKLAGEQVALCRRFSRAARWYGFGFRKRVSAVENLKKFLNSGNIPR